MVKPAFVHLPDWIRTKKSRKNLFQASDSDFFLPRRREYEANNILKTLHANDAKCRYCKILEITEQPNNEPVHLDIPRSTRPIKISLYMQTYICKNAVHGFRLHLMLLVVALCSGSRGEREENTF